jgi:hypothetical protein
MQSRREFIQAGLAASVVPVALPIRDAMSPALDVSIVSSSRHALYAVVCDVRSRCSTELAREAARLGTKVVRTAGDITDFWFDELSRRWTQAPVAIAGLTAHGPLFCLERFGWDHGLRVAFRGTHRLLDRRGVEHTLTGPLRTVASAHCALADDEWPTYLARLLVSCAVTQDTASTTVRSAIVGDRTVEIDDTLFSWVIAPKHA